MKKKDYRNNLEEQPYEHYLALYREALPQDISAHLNLPYSEVTHCFYLRFLGSNYTVSHPEFTVRCLGGGNGIPTLETDRYAQILLLRYFLEGDHAESMGTYMAFRELPWGDTYYRQFQSRCVDRLARTYGNRLPEFRAVMESLWGVPYAHGDACYDVELLNGLFVRLVLWQGDEEFPPSGQILFSDNFLNAFFGDDMAYVGDIVLGHMAAFTRRETQA